jgi:hypothetical protein
MSKNEIKGLQQLAMAQGGSLTINPDTGLVEAGFLEQALPIVAAAAATYFTAGAAAPALSAALGSTMAGGIAAGALSGAAISGGVAALQGKDAGHAAMMGGLGGALSGGLGAYDAAPNVLADATQKAAVDTGTQTATQATPAVYGGTAASPADYQAGLSGTSPTLNAANPSMVPTQTPTPTLNAGDVEAQAGGFYGGQAPSNPYADMSNQGISNVTGIKTPTTTPSFYSTLEPNGIGRAAVQALPVASLLEDKGPTIGGQPEKKRYGYELSPNFQRYEPVTPNPYYSARYPTYAAEGGIMDSFRSGGYNDNADFDDSVGTDDLNSGGIMLSAGGVPSSKPPEMPSFNVGIVSDNDPNTRSLSALDAANYRNKKLMGKAGIKMAEMPKTGIKGFSGDFSDVGAAGGIADLGGYSDGGRLLKGPGDGMSDNIPATIGRKQPARLADGEFVVPADVVSHLGNGSTDAGAKKLYSMMDKIRRARTGKKKQAPAVKANKFMPA